jgi:surface polysaccharide O-acyltransferase-like enzyme
LPIEREIKNPSAWIGYGNLMRILACIAVVALHTSAWVLFFDTDIGQGTWQFNNILSACCRWCVPLFVMLSGAIFLDRPVAGSAWAFIRKRVERVGIPLIFWSVFYFAWNDYSRMQEFNLKNDLLLILKGQPHYHLYFLFVMIGLYTITPWLKAWQDRSTKKSQLVSVGVILVVSSIAVSACKLFSVHTENALTFFIPFIGYYLLGFQLKDLKLGGGRLVLAWLGFITMILVAANESVLIAQISWAKDPKFFDLFYVYCNPAIVVMSACVFLMISNSRMARKIANGEQLGSRGWLRVIGRTTFGIYLIHPLVLDFNCAVYYWSLHLPRTAWLETTALASSTVIESFIVIYIFMKVPYLKEVVN